MRMSGYARLMWLRLIKGQIIPGPNPYTDTPSKDYNVVVDRVSKIDSTLFATGYDLMKVREPLRMRTRSVAVQSSIYVPTSEYEELVAQVSAIEDLLTVPNAAILQVKEADGGDIGGATNIPYAKGEYVTEAEFAVLKGHVDDIEEMLSGTIDRLLIVPC